MKHINIHSHSAAYIIGFSIGVLLPSWKLAILMSIILIVWNYFLYVRDRDLPIFTYDKNQQPQIRSYRPRTPPYKK